VLAKTGLWRDLQELPDTLAATLDARDGFAETAALLGATGVRRVVASGNGAAYYVTMALWLAALERGGGPELVAVPAGLLARGAFPWRAGDALLAVSSSGELRDLVEAIDAGAPAPYAAITATPGSALGGRAGARSLVTVRNQRAVTHTQAFCGAVVAALAVWGELTGDEALGRVVAGAPAHAAASLAPAQAWLDGIGDLDPPAAIAFGGGPGWAAALEAALLLKEIAGVPAEGVETREGATSAMMALQPGHLALGVPAAADALLDEAEAACRGRGATVLRAPASAADPLLAAVTTHVPTALLAARIGLARGLDVDSPAWVEDYYRVARAPA
jgi:glutamine---fructose-6-phosphate transaminase (isomerizing)